MYKKNKLNKFVIIMPMAGRGVRFKKYGIDTPKPLIKINNLPMFAASAMAFSKKFKWFFIVQKIVNNNKIFKKSLKFFKNKKVVILNKYTNGQASTVGKVIKYLTKNQTIIVHSCDLYFKINFVEIKKKLKKYDIIVLTAQGKEYNFKNSTQFSWVRKNNNNRVEISLKNNFSKNKKKNRVVVGSFIFKNKEILKKSIDYITKHKLKIKNEYYLDHAASISKKIGYELGEIVVKKYKSWGSLNEIKI